MHLRFLRCLRHDPTALQRLLVFALLFAGGLAIGLAFAPRALTAQEPADTTNATAGALADDVLPLEGDQVAWFYRVKWVPADVLAKYLPKLGLDLKGVELIPYGATKFAAAADIEKLRGDINQPHNILIVKTTPERLSLLRDVMALVDIPTRQVVLEVRVIELRHSNKFEFGFEFDLDRTGIINTFFQAFDLNFSPPAYLESLPTSTPPPFQGFSLNFESAGSDLQNFGISNFAVRALQERGDAEILSNPRMLIEEGKPGEVFSGETILIQRVTEPEPNKFNVQLVEKNVGVTLKVLPLIIGDKSVRLRLEPKVDEITGFTSPGQFGISNPITSSRSISTLCTVQDGQTLTLGGLLQTQSEVETGGIPILMDIPLVGELFKSHRRVESRTEIVFLLTPHIVRRTEMGGRALITPDSE